MRNDFNERDLDLDVIDKFKDDDDIFLEDSFYDNKVDDSNLASDNFGRIDEDMDFNELLSGGEK